MKTNTIECPNCYHRMSMDDMLDESWTRETKPAANDFTICASCGTLLRFEDKDVHAISDEELELLEPDQLKVALACQEVVLSEAYQREFKAGLLNKPRVNQPKDL